MIGVITLHHAVHLLHLEDMPQLLLIGLASCEVFGPPSCICSTISHCTVESPKHDHRLRIRAVSQAKCRQLNAFKI